MSTYSTKEVLLELKAILEASKLQPIVTISDLKPLTELTNDLTIDISLESVIYTQETQNSGRSGYMRNNMILVHVGVDCREDPTVLYDTVDEIENSILEDSDIWTVVVDRDITSVSYDHNETPPYRGATILMEALVRLSCP